MTRVTAPSRLHFGLFHVPADGFTHWPGIDGNPGLPVRALGGVGRGERWAVGVRGFDRGELVVEGGKTPGEEVSPVLARLELPTAWRIVLFTPGARDRWHGGREQQAFAAAAAEDRPGSRTEALC